MTLIRYCNKITCNFKAILEIHNAIYNAIHNAIHYPSVDQKQTFS